MKLGDVVLTESHWKRNILILAGVFTIGVLIAWWMHRPLSVNTVDVLREEMRQELQKRDERITEIDNRVRKEVGKIRETVKQEVSSMSTDGVADALNAELAEFRRLDVPSQRNVNF